MSILYGYVNLKNEKVDPAVLNDMGASLSDYKSDAHTTIIGSNIGMGFLNQQITYESQFDNLPYYDKDNGLYFICDAIIDNRDELIGLLNIKSVNELSDSQIIFEAYKKWNKNCAKYLLGDYAFVIYDEKANQVYMFRDHMGKRFIYYRIVNNLLFFSTLIKSLIIPYCGYNQLNEQYLIEFLSIEGVRQDITPGITIYRDIYYVLPASCLTINNYANFNEVYWDPTKIKVDKSLSQTDYIKEFKNIFSEAVKCRLRTTGNVGIFLSGGMDSSSVACVAASLLKERNSSLNTYTSVPMAGSTNWAPAYNIVDESILVKKMQVFYPNMNTQFIDSKGKNSLNVTDRMLQIFEQPYKFIDNSYWLDDIFQIASNDGCKIMLNGNFGNAAISYGSLETHFFEHVMRMRGIRFVKDLQSVCCHNHISRKKTIAYILKEISKVIFLPEKYHSQLVKNVFQKKYSVNKKMHAVGLTSKPFHRFRDEQMMFFHSTVTNHFATSITKLGLANNICERDPTSDKRVVEFCLRIPYDCYFYKEKGLDRGIIRQAMQGIVPSVILENSRYKGLQAADWLERIDNQWKDFISGFLMELKNQGDIFKYINSDYLSGLIKDNMQLSYSYDVINNVREILAIYACNKFIRMLQ